LQVRTVAAILVWFVVALLLLNRFFRSEWVLPISIVLTVIAVLIYFSPRIRKTQNPTDKKPNPEGLM
jgi:heme/copper-type cytochrome/quinol oxidase subunit 2